MLLGSCLEFVLCVHPIPSQLREAVEKDEKSHAKRK